MNVLLAVEDSTAVGLAEDLLQNLVLPDPSYVAVVAASRAEVRPQLKEVAQRQRREGVEASTITLTGDPVRSILKLATDLPADLVVVGVGGGPEATTGLAAKLVQHCQCPVGVARNGRPVRRVLIAFNLPETATRALDFLSQFPWQDQGGVTYYPLVVVPEKREADEARARGMLEDFEQRVAEWKNLTCEPKLEVGPPAATILKLAESLDVDLLVVGNRELSAPARLFLGSVSNQVMNQAPCNVLVIRGRVSAPLPTEDHAAEELV